MLSYNSLLRASGNDDASGLREAKRKIMNAAHPYREQRQQQPWWPLLWLLTIIGLLLVILFHPVAKVRAGGPWSVGALSLAALLMVYLQPGVQGLLKRLARARARRRYYRDKERREQEYREQEYLNSQSSSNASIRETHDHA